jgi:hypothetical protein
LRGTFLLDKNRFYSLKKMLINLKLRIASRPSTIRVATFRIACSRGNSCGERVLETAPSESFGYLALHA